MWGVKGMSTGYTRQVFDLADYIGIDRNKVRDDVLEERRLVRDEYHGLDEYHVHVISINHVLDHYASIAGWPGRFKDDRELHSRIFRNY
jgi:hypothetical protein